MRCISMLEKETQVIEFTGTLTNVWNYAFYSKISMLALN